MKGSCSRPFGLMATAGVSRVDVQEVDRGRITSLST